METVNTEEEVWKEISLNPNYLVSNLGRVKSIERDVPCASSKSGFRHKKEKFLTLTDKHGYYSVGFNDKNGKLISPLVHKLVMYAFGEIKSYPEWEIDHVNGNSYDNRFCNLEYVSSSENTKRAYKLGLQDKAALSLSKRNRKMTPEQIVEMKDQFVREGRKISTGTKVNNIDFYKRYADMYNMKPRSVYNIITGRTNRFFGKDIVQTTNNQ